VGAISATVVFGTRPEAVKLAPVVLELQSRPERFHVAVCVTAQHREMLDPVLDTFDIAPNIDLDLMTHDQAPAALAARVLEGMQRVFENRATDWIIVQGDTTTTMAAALAAFYRRVKVGHVEAGLRTHDRYRPYPEEINRRITTQVADLHFAPTERARQNLLHDGVDSSRVFVTGNTVIDALLMAREKVAALPQPWPHMNRLGDRRMVLITAHRRENFGRGLVAICRAIRTLATRFPDVEFVYPVHLNPNVQKPVYETLDGIANVHLTAPLDYVPFIAAMERCSFLLSDSGGIQEEAPALGKPVLVMRDVTERPEAVEAGTAKLVGANEDRIVEEVSRLLTDSRAYGAMSQARNPFGDGASARRIADILVECAGCEGQ